MAAEHVAATRNAVDMKHLTNVKRMADPKKCRGHMQVKWHNMLLQAPLNFGGGRHVHGGNLESIR